MLRTALAALLVVAPVLGRFAASDDVRASATSVTSESLVALHQPAVRLLGVEFAPRAGSHHRSRPDAGGTFVMSSRIAAVAFRRAYGVLRTREALPHSAHRARGYDATAPPC